MVFHAAGPDHWLYIAVAVATHAVAGYALASAATGGERAGLVAATLPDVDLLFAPAWPAPFVHRGITHTPVVAAGLLGALLLAGARRDVVAGAAMGYGSHLLVDTFTASGVAWFYPLPDARVAVDAGAHTPEGNLLVAGLALAALAIRRGRPAEE